MEACLKGKKKPGLSFFHVLIEKFQVDLNQFLTQKWPTPQAISAKVDKIKLVVSDIDGVLTDGGMYYTESGDEGKKFNTKDGMALKRLHAAGFLTGFLSNGFNTKLIESRAALLKVNYTYVGKDAKVPILEKWMATADLNWENVAYIGDDINDLAVIEHCGLSACPRDAVSAVQAKVDLLLSRKGGDACFREFVDEWLLNNQKA